MEKKVRSKEELLKEKDHLLEVYNSEHRRNKKPGLLTKKERKALGIGKDQGKAILRNARISSRKVKIVLDLIKNKPLEEAYAIVKFTPKAASEILYKLLKSAEANAVNNNGLNKDVLYVADAVASQGPTLKRMRPRAQGRGFRINKRTSNITVVLKEKK
ncbi:50S ribosomal protein L22 [Clostridium thermosuccinogenes]|uniref:Large ribosomal subunit protein uL22 n=1 Tax=Clostridium thermosuccinogenes TaxID=84032 RepID=A0A2K2FCT4_9CLOT|nr:50S ribosomal protein L22 [Pseudoclostridium thermosuccinogenes]AUS98141.1 50S ribosomal protein L22 [Pseudoclostridium thermosuccinogenes]PNT91204.1 50S ribosomal protein L22 [Pseudoclostridium thermosuccinogenes]PNT95388.1 50S ribosomal protein L22 [Pseudoclostridium thermosuccinogenes]PNT96564.1 50S ribosomal protein L22 [Pseudoclostridium thermosuccinogenes]